MPLPELGEVLAKYKKVGWIGKWPRLKAIMKAQKTEDSRKVKEGLLKGMRRVFPGDDEAEKQFDGIFSWGKAHPSANWLYGMGSDLGMMYLVGKRSGWPLLEDIMSECHVKTRDLAKKHLMPGFYAVLGTEEGDIAWDRIFPMVKNANLIRLEGRTIGLQHQLGTLYDLKTLKEFGKKFGTTNTRTIANLFLEVLTDLFGEEGGKESYLELFPHIINPKIIALLHLEGHQLAELYIENKILIIPTFTDYMRLYEVYGRDVVSKYILEGMGEILDKKKLKEACDDVFFQKKHLETEQKDGLRAVGHDLGHRYKNGERTTTYVLYKLMDKFGIGDIRTAKRHILAGLNNVLGNIMGEIALETYFGNVHPNAEAIMQYATDLARKIDAGEEKEKKTLKELSVKFNASEETTSKYVYEAFVLECGEQKGPKLYEKSFPHDLHGLLGSYNHPILEEGIVEVVTANFEDPKHAPTIETEKLDGNVKHDILIENIHEGGWFQHQLARLTPQHDTFQEALKLTDAEVTQYIRVSSDFTTWDEKGRLEEKDEKYADDHTLLLMVLTKYNETDKYKVRIPENQPHARVISAEMFFLLCGAETPALDLVRKVRDLTRQGKVAELRTWKMKVDQELAPSFLNGQQSLDPWLDANSETGEGQKEESNAVENEEEERKEKPASDSPEKQGARPGKEPAG